MTRIQALSLSILAAAMLVGGPALADCKDCGTVAEVKTIKKDAANDQATATAARIHKLASFSSDASLRLSQLTAGYGMPL